ncbi:unnamed protein product [Agarophyton chilense]
MYFSSLLAISLSLSFAAALSSGAEHVGNAFGGSTVNPDRVYLPGLVKLAFFANTFTTPRRTVPRPQLTCSGGNASDRNELYPPRVDCYNAGVDPDADGNPIPKWECIAAVDRSVQIDEWSVHCEGWSFEQDLYIVKGSCWLEYNLSFSNESVAPPATGAVADGVVSSNGTSALQWLLGALRNVVILIVVICAVAFFCCNHENPLSAEREPFVEINPPQNYAATSER